MPPGPGADREQAVVSGVARAASSSDARLLPLLDPLIGFEVARWLEPYGQLKWHDLTNDGISLSPYIKPAMPPRPVPCAGYASKRPLEAEEPSLPNPVQLFADLNACYKRRKFQPLATHDISFWSSYLNWVKLLHAKHDDALFSNPVLRVELLERTSGLLAVQLSLSSWERSTRLYRADGFDRFVRLSVSDAFKRKTQTDASFARRVHSFLERDFVRTAFRL
jgi:hypothetical protein